MISPLTATVYLPLLPSLKSQFSISGQAVNMTLTIYIIFQALSPAIFGPLSKLKGRRPVYLLTPTIYALVNLGMALNKHNYAVRLLLRALQSFGVSAAFAINYGIVADICVTSERGKTTGWVGMTLNLGTCVGPILGGTVAYLSGECQWVFWGLLGVGLALLVVVSMFLPETVTAIVGNGSKRDANLLHGNIYKETYNFNPLYIGLVYLPRGVGIITGGYINGRIMDHNYQVFALRGSYYLLIISTATLIGYGWAAKESVYFVILLVLQFVQGFWGTCFYTIYNTLLVDSFPHSPGAAAASASITRCAMAAVAGSILEPLFRSSSGKS
ncbi:major facilitator superfamily domain-containing protein [Aspergillus parasiticus]|uniref:Major facilitator superfamily domain-containing protein n=1 Tax=Aspergillus parasiticus TaxID=5067 RepID=A0A5N6E1M7_ASPPA|nr:major facilitator superfamily domain-containing protein [Aspergillus parasiticus]